MTCIVGLVKSGIVHMAADSAGVAGLNMCVRTDQKIFTRGPIVMGCTSSFRMIQLLRFTLVVPARNPEADVFEWMCTAFIDSVRTTFRNGGYMHKDKDAEFGGTFLVGVGGRLFSVQDDYQVGERSDQFDACGSGEDLALGSLFTTRGDDDPRRRLQAALEAAEHFNAGVRQPFHFLESKP